jgi:transcriptional regulator NrdR family protein
VKARLKTLDCVCFDPANHTTNWSPLKEMVDIDRSDVVIANLWRESIGTVVGIVQARRKGKPVILIDSNYLDSSVLKMIVGKDSVVHSVEGAINKLQREIMPQLAESVSVRKRNGTVEPFRLVKLHSSLNALCAEAMIEDAVLPDLVAREVHNAVKGAARNGTVESEQIKNFVFDQLDQLSRLTDKLYEDDLKHRASLLKAVWEKYQHTKDDRRALEDLAQEEKQKEQVQNAKIKQLESDNTLLRRNLHECEEQLSTAMNAEASRVTSVLEAVEKAKAQFASGLVFHEQALQSAADSPYRHPDRVYYALSLLAQYAEAKQEPDNETTRLPLGDWLRERGCPFEFANNESRGTRNNPETKKQRTVIHQGAQVVFRKHLKIGKCGDANECSRIYFEILDDGSGKVLIGHVGRHLRTAQD